MRYFFFLLILFSQSTYAQTVRAYQLLPANATANDPLKLVLTVFHGGCGGNFGYSFVRSGNSLAIKGCYPAVTIALPCSRSDTLQIGRLPAGSYTVTAASYLAMTPADCPGAPFVASGQPNATGSFTVGTALASRAPVPKWQFSPTVLPATASTLYLTNASLLQWVRVYDATGREKAHFDASVLVVQNGTTQVPLPNLAPALYLLRVMDEANRVSTQRFVRQ